MNTNRTFHYLFQGLNVLAVTGISLFLILVAVNLGPFHEWTSEWVSRVTEYGSPVQMITVAVDLFLLLTNIIFLVTSAASSPYDTHIRTRTDDGELMVAVGAAEETLEKAVRSLAGVSEVSVQLFKAKDRENEQTRVRARFRTTGETNFKQIGNDVLSVLRERFQQVIETDEMPYFEVELIGVSEDQPRKQTRDQTSNEGEEEDPYSSEQFSGPEYPVEESE